MRLLIALGFFLVNFAVAADNYTKECRSKFPKKVCVVKKGTLDECETPSVDNDISNRLQKLYDFYPKPLRLAFCSLKKIYIDSSLTAATGRGEGDSIRLQKSMFDEPSTLSKFLTKKERKALGLDPEGQDCPQISAGIEDLKDEAIAYLIAHELGHIVDYQIKATGFYDGIDGQMAPLKDSFAALSWKAGGFDDDIPLPINSFDGRKLLKFNSSRIRPIPNVQDIARTYKDCAASNFLTTYASVNTSEDFAESFAIQTLASTNSLKLEIRCPPQTAIDVVQKLRSENFKDKAEWMHRRFTSIEEALWSIKRREPKH